MNCGNCNKPFEGRNFGFVVKGGVVDICSTVCRAEYRQKAEAAKTSRRKASSGSGNAENVAKVRKPPTPSEIKKKLRPKETDISASIASQLDGAGVWNTRVQSGSVKTATGYVRLAKPGTPDRVAAAGVPVWIEVKRPDEKPTAGQLATHAELRSNGSLVFVVDDARDVRVILDGLRRFRPEIESIARFVREIQTSIDGDLNRDRAKRD